MKQMEGKSFVLRKMEEKLSPFERIEEKREISVKFFINDHEKHFTKGFIYQQHTIFLIPLTMNEENEKNKDVPFEEKVKFL